MAKIPKRVGTIADINRKTYGHAPRGYLGMSSIAEPCRRKLWYKLHWASSTQYSARTQRIFDIGHLFEEIAIKDLKNVGCCVFQKIKDQAVHMTGEVNEEQEEFIGFAGHAKGHPDGRIKGVYPNKEEEMLLELKTCKDDKFKKVKELGVQRQFPIYYGQAQRYMLEMEYSKAYFLFVNKNTCEYYDEIVDLDYSFAKDLVRKEQHIIISDSPPDKHYSSGNYNCNWCDNNDVCHNHSEPQKNCRTCDYCDIEDKGVWSCTNAKHNEEASNGLCEDEYSLSLEEQRKGCDYWTKGWGL